MLQGAAILLAAGASTRFGADKRLIEIHGKPLIAVTLSKYLPVFSRVLVIVRTRDAVVDLIPDDCEVVVADQANLGMSKSLAAGIHRVKSEPWVVVGLADMPFIQVNTLELLRDTLTLSSPDIVRLRHNMRFGNPVGFRSRFFQPLTELDGDVGAKPILRKHAKNTRVLDVADEGILQDLDTPEDLRVFARITQPRSPI